MVNLRICRLAVLVSLLAFTGAARVAKRKPIEEWEPLAGRSEEEIQEFIKRQGDAKITGAKPLPPPVTDTSLKLVDDAGHQWRAAGREDKRGPCPAMNTLANHGYYSRTGVDTPANLVNAVQRGFNMEYNLAVFTVYYSHVLMGNPLTNLLSVGTHSPRTGPDPIGYPTAPIGGLATHGDFEGDTSQSRADAHWGSNIAYNQSIFDQFLAACDQYGGIYNTTSASFMRYSRYTHSRNTNPEFVFDVPRYTMAYAETTFPFAFFQDGREKANGTALDCRSMQTFYQFGRMPAGFYRRGGTFSLLDVGAMITAMRQTYQLEAGRKDATGNFVPATATVQSDLDNNGPCTVYKWAFNKVTTILYPNATGQVKAAIQQNFANLYQPLAFLGDACPQLFPYA